MAGSSGFAVWLREALFMNLGTKLVSVLVAAVLWVVVLGSRSVEVSKDVPLEILAPSDLVVANEVPDRVSFRISGPKAFVRAVLDRRETPIRINLTGAKAGPLTYRFYSDSIRLPLGVKVQAINPSAVVVNLENVKTRSVTVKADLRGEVPEGYQLISAEITPPQVKIKGAKSRINAINEVVSLPIELFDLHQSEEKILQLDLEKSGIELDGEAPKIKLEVRALTANFRLKNIPVKVLSDVPAKLLEKSVTLFIRAGAEELKRLDSSKVYAEVDLRGKPKGRHTERIRVVLPKEVGLVKALPESVHVQLGE